MIDYPSVLPTIPPVSRSWLTSPLSSRVACCGSRLSRQAMCCYSDLPLVPLTSTSPLSSCGLFHCLFFKNVILPSPLYYASTHTPLPSHSLPLPTHPPTTAWLESNDSFPSPTPLFTARPIQVVADSPGKVTDMQQNVFMVLLVPSLKSGFTSDVVDGSHGCASTGVLCWRRGITAGGLSCTQRWQRVRSDTVLGGGGSVEGETWTSDSLPLLPTYFSRRLLEAQY